MAGVAEKLGEILNLPRNNLVASDSAFPAIDVDGTARRLKLRERAQEQGARGLPSADSSLFDGAEQEIANEMENEAKTRLEAYWDRQKVYASRANAARSADLMVQIGGTTDAAIANFQREIRTGVSELFDAGREVVSTTNELDRFKAEHRIKSPPRNYQSKAVKVGLLIPILLIEAVLNGTFLARGSAFGLAGGVLEALIIAGINVAVGVIAGRYILPWTLYRLIVVRLLAALLFAAYMAWTFVFNLAVAHYRTAMTEDPFDAPFLAYQSLVANPIGLADLQSWALLVVGLVFSFVACLDGWLMDDPYPGYGARMRHNVSALRRYTNLKDDLLGDLDGIKDDAERELDRLARAIIERAGEQLHIAAQSQSFARAMEEHFGHIESAGNTLLSLYREENLRHRAPDTAPRRFQERWKYQRPHVGDSALALTGFPSAADTEKEVRAEVLTRRTALHDEFRKAHAEYKRIDHMLIDEAAK